jgi:GNAT superfamily N-acetyltransferase
MSQEEVIIRRARQEDAAAIAAIIQAVGWFEPFGQVTREDARRIVEERLVRCLHDECHTVLVAERARAGVVGYLSVHWYPHLARGDDGYISELFLHPDERGRGIGGRLLRAIEQYARERHCVRLLLLNRRDRESYRRGFYRKHGWEELPQGAFFTRFLAG